MTAEAPADLGFIGLGKMGSPIAERLLTMVASWAGVSETALVGRGDV